MKNYDKEISFINTALVALALVIMALMVLLTINLQKQIKLQKEIEIIKEQRDIELKNLQRKLEVLQSNF